MARYAKPIEKLLQQLKRLPGIGEKTATRLALYILRSTEEENQALAESILNIKKGINLCSICLNITDQDPCMICQDSKRKTDTICVVEDAADLIAIEKTGVFNGLYHVLHGALSPLDGVGPDDIKTDRLIDRIKKGGVREVIIATNPSVEGEATSLYLIQSLKPFDLTVTRIAYGIPAGGDLEYADRITLGKALENRHPA